MTYVDFEHIKNFKSDHIVKPRVRLRRPSITRHKYKERFWFDKIEKHLVWFPKAFRKKTKRNTYALTKSFILEVAKAIKRDGSGLGQDNEGVDN